MKSTNTEMRTEVEYLLDKSVDTLLSTLNFLISRFPNIEKNNSDFPLIESLLQLTVTNKNFTMQDVERRLQAFARDNYETILIEGKKHPTHDYIILLGERIPVSVITGVFSQHRDPQYQEQIIVLLSMIVRFDPTNPSKYESNNLLKSIMDCIMRFVASQMVDEQFVPTNAIDRIIRGFSASDVSFFLQSFIQRSIWYEAMMPLKNCLHSFGNQDLTSLSLIDEDIHILYSNGTRICAEQLTDNIAPYLSSNTKNKLSTEQGRIDKVGIHTEDLQYYLENTERKFDATHIVRSLLIASANIYIRKRFNQLVRPIEKIVKPGVFALSIDSALTAYQWQFANKSVVHDHSESRVRHLCSRVESKHYEHDYSKEEIDAAIVIQRAIKKLTRSSIVSLVRVNNKTGDHSDLAHHMIAHESGLKKSVNVVKNSHFVELMQTPTWFTDALFQMTDDYQYYALSAMLSGSISPDQCGTLIRWRNAKQIGSHFTTYPILAVADIAKPPSQAQKLHDYQKTFGELNRILQSVELADFDTIPIDTKVQDALQSSVRLHIEGNISESIPTCVEKLLKRKVEKFKNGQWKNEMKDEIKDVECINQTIHHVTWAVANDQLTLLEGVRIIQYLLILTTRENQEADALKTASDELKSLVDQKEHIVPLSLEAEKLLRPWLSQQPSENHEFRTPLTSEQVTQFFKLVTELPPSERLFYHFTTGEQVKGGFAVARSEYIELSEGAKNIYNMLAYGNNTAKCDLRFGHFNIDDIEAAERDSLRPGAMATYDSTPTVRVHDIDLSQYEANRHDDGHAVLLSLLPKQVRNLFFMLSDIVRDFSGHAWSAFRWQIIDFAYISNLSIKMTHHQDQGSSIIFTLNKDQRISPIELFSDIIFGDFSTDLFQIKNDNTAEEKIDEHKYKLPKCVFWAMILDMLQHPLKWQFHGVNLKQLPPKLNIFYQFAHECFHMIHDNDKKFALLKLKAFYTCRKDIAPSLLNQKINECVADGTLGEIKIIRRNLRIPPLLSIQVNRTIIDEVKKPQDLLYSIGILDTIEELQALTPMSQNRYRFAWCDQATAHLELETSSVPGSNYLG